MSCLSPFLTEVLFLPFPSCLGKCRFGGKHYICEPMALWSDIGIVSLNMSEFHKNLEILLLHFPGMCVLTQAFSVHISSIHLIVL
jgi:hypothetical protein